jgi:hypothetical protein
MSGGVTSFTFTVMVAAEVFDQGGVLQWTPINGTTQRWFNDVAASSPTDWMAVGNNGLTARWNGSSWVALPAIVTENINAVTAIGPGEYLAATGAGAVLHFKNKVWTEIYRRGTPATFRAIWAKDSTQIVAVGDAGITSHAYNGAWIDEDLPTLNGGSLTAVSGSADGSHVSAVNGDFLSSEVWTSTGEGAFVTDPTFPTAIVGLATDVTYDAAGDGLVSFVDVGGPMISYIIRTNGDTVLFLNDIWPKALVAHGVDQLAVGFLYNGDGNHYIADLDYSTIPGPFNGISDPLGSPFDFAQMTATNGAATQFAVTSANNGHLLRWNGAIWSDPQGSGDWQDPDLWGIGDTLFALDGIGGFYKIVGGVPTTLPSEPGLHRLWGISSTEFWAVDATEVWHFDPVNGWTDEHTVPNGSDNRDIWADPSGDAVIALGENGEVSSRILGVWSDTAIGHNVNAVWGCDSHTAWIVTQEGGIYKWINGVISLDVATGPNPLRAINGNVFCDPWVAGDNGTMYHRLGGTWTNRFDPSAASWNLRAVALRGAGQTIAAGDNGNAGLFSDASPVQSTPLPTQGKGIQALWRLSNGEVYAAGDQVLLRGHR